MKRFVKAGIVLVVVAGVVIGGWQYTEWSGKRFAKAKVDNLRYIQYRELFNTFTPELQDVYKTAEQFDRQFGQYGIAEGTDEPEFVSKATVAKGIEYSYTVRRQDETELGYSIKITTNKSFVNKQVADLFIQPIRFNE